MLSFFSNSSRTTARAVQTPTQSESQQPEQAQHRQPPRPPRPAQSESQQPQQIQRRPPPRPPRPAQPESQLPQQSQRRPPARLPRPPLPPRLSTFSTPAVQNSAWSSIDFMLGAGMVIIQPSTHKIVVVYETEKKYWFLPRGRKDVGESLEQTALREAYEETGYRAEFLPLLNPTHQPTAPENRDNPNWFNIEPIYMTLTSWQPKKRRNGAVEAHGGEYITTWYVGQIPDGALPETGTGMPDEQNYESHLLPVDEAIDCLWDSERLVVSYAWRVYCHTETEKARVYAEVEAEAEQQQS